MLPKYAICNETFEEMPWDRAFAMAREIGYTGLEIAPFTLGANALEIGQETKSKMIRAAKAADLEIIGLHWLLAKTNGYHLTTSEAEVRNRTAVYLKDLARLCRDLGGDLMVLGSPQQRNFGAELSHDQAMINACDVLQQVAPTLEELQVRIAVEPLGPQEGNFLNFASQARQLIDMVDSPMVRLHLDVKAMSSEGKPIEQIVRENSAYTIHFHANDPNKLGPGMGEVDFVPILRALGATQYTGWISVEVFDYSPGAENILRQSMDCLMRCQSSSS